MAKRESQGLQIALILFVMITVVLALTTFVFYRQTEEMAAKVDAAEKAKETADELVQQQSFWNSYFKHIVGAGDPMTEAALNIVIPSVEGDEEMAAVHASYQQDIATYGEGLPKEKLNNMKVRKHYILVNTPIHLKGLIWIMLLASLGAKEVNPPNPS